MNTSIVTTPTSDPDLDGWLKSIKPGKRAATIKAIVRFALANDLLDQIPLHMFYGTGTGNYGGQRVLRGKADLPVAGGVPPQESPKAERPASVTPVAVAEPVKPQPVPAPVAVPARAPIAELVVVPPPAPEKQGNGIPRWKTDPGNWPGPYIGIGETLPSQEWRALSKEERQAFVLAHVPMELEEKYAMAALEHLSPRVLTIPQLKELYNIMELANQSET